MKIPTLFITCALLAALFYGCTSMKPNPEYYCCLDQCREEKKKCVLGAMTAEAITACDTIYASCMENCSTNPAAIPSQ